MAEILDQLRQALADRYVISTPALDRRRRARSSSSDG